MRSGEVKREEIENNIVRVKISRILKMIRNGNNRNKKQAGLSWAKISLVRVIVDVVVKVSSCSWIRRVLKINIHGWVAG